MSTVLSIDLGTSSISALALSVDQGQIRILSRRNAPHGADVEGLPPGWHEQDPRMIVNGALRLVGELVRDLPVASGDISGIGITGQMHGVVLAGEKLEPLTNLITWRDRRTLEGDGPGSLARAVKRLGPTAPQRAGCVLSAGYGGSTLHWLRENGRLPEGRALALADYAAALLSGDISSDPTHAASWGLWDVERDAWDAESLELLSLPESIFPRIHKSGTSLGTILPEMASRLGVPEGVSVCAPLGDNQASFIGATGFDRKAAVLNLGTGGQISVWREEYSYIPGLETRPFPLGGSILLGASLCGGWSYAYLCRLFREVAREVGGVEVTAEEAYARLNELAARAPRGAGGIVADTRFSGTRADPGLRGSFTGIGEDNLHAAHLARAVLEGMVRELVEEGARAGMSRVARIVASGNAVRKNGLVQKIVTELSGLPCEVSGMDEEAAAGAALCAAVGLGLQKPEEST